jgi:hypothetical protein
MEECVKDHIKRTKGVEDSTRFSIKCYKEDQQYKMLRSYWKEKDRERRK